MDLAPARRANNGQGIELHCRPSVFALTMDMPAGYRTQADAAATHGLL
jgi:hypothetical protein